MHTYLYTIRHARTTFSEEQRYAGTIDAPLSARGIREAKVAAERLREVALDVVIPSTQTRAVDTARILVGDSVPMAPSPLCVERNYGALQGHTSFEAKRFKPKIMFVKVGGDTHSVNPPGAEPFENVRARATKMRRFIFARYRGSRVLVVSHSTFLQQFHGVLRGTNCVESLAEYVPTLRLTLFVFSGNRLIEERQIKLLDEERFEW
jgi:broad specificity phosphatase PhoE